MKLKVLVASVALVTFLTGCAGTSTYSSNGNVSEQAQETSPDQSQDTVPTLSPEQVYEQDWAKYKSHIYVDVNCDSYAYTGSTVGTITNDTAVDLEVSVTLGYLHSDGSIAGEVYAEYVDLPAHASQRVQFTDPQNGFSYDSCKVLEIRDERYGND